MAFPSLSLPLTGIKFIKLYGSGAARVSSSFIVWGRVWWGLRGAGEGHSPWKDGVSP